MKRKLKIASILTACITAAMIIILSVFFFTPDTLKFSFTQRKGIALVYEIAYGDKNMTNPFGAHNRGTGSENGPFRTSFSFRGELVLKDHASNAGDRIVSAVIGSVEESAFTLNGIQVFSKNDNFPGTSGKHEVFIRLSGKNDIKSFYFHPSTSQAYRQFMISMLEEIQVGIEEKSHTWKKNEYYQHGLGKAEYVVENSDGKGACLSKTISEYEHPGFINGNDWQQINMRTEIKLNPGGYVESIVKKEETKIFSADRDSPALYVDKEVRLALKGERGSDSGILSNSILDNYVRINPGGNELSEEIKLSLLKKRVASLTIESILHWIRTYKTDKKDNSYNNGVFYRATGYLELHPDDCGKILNFFFRQAKTTEETHLIMNLLAGAGNPHAQKAMLEILKSKKGRNDPKYGFLIQNFSIMDTLPIPEVMEYLEKVMNDENVSLSCAAANSYGALVHKIYTSGNKDKAMQYNRRLLGLLPGAKTATALKEYVGAVGNAGIFENSALLFDYMNHDFPEVRTESVMALRKTDTAQTRQKAVESMEDDVLSVQRSALQACLHFNLEKENMKRIRKLVKKGVIDELNYYDLVTLLKKEMGRYPGETRDCFVYILKRKLKDPELKARVRALISYNK